MLRPIRRDQIGLGMFIHALEGSWLRHPFWRQRSLLEYPADLTLLLDSDVATLLIDTEKVWT